MKRLLHRLSAALKAGPFKALLGGLRALAASPFATMWLVVGMYAVKAALKIGLGQHINSPMIAGDGFHNLADILEALAVLLVIWISRRPTSDDYPFGKKNVEFFTSLAIGSALLLMSCNFALQSAAGIIAIFPNVDAAVRSVLPLPVHHPLVMSHDTFGYVFGLTLGSVLLSFLISRHQIAVGKKSGHASLIADGEETASDGRIELITLVGVLGEYFFHAPWLEYPLGLLVAAVIAHTGWELFMGGFRVLLQHSIGAEHESEIRRRCLAVVGVDSLTGLKTFQIGSTAVCLLTVVTEHNTSTIATMKYGLEHTLKDYILSAGFKECELHLKFQKPEPQRHRVAFAVAAAEGQLVVSPTVEQASHIIICDVEHGDIVRSKQEPKPVDLTEFLKRKRVTCLYLFHSAPESVEGVAVASSPSFQAQLVGLTPNLALKRV
jgi:cation diffusion facilitator family transporter